MKEKGEDAYIMVKSTVVSSYRSYLKYRSRLIFFHCNSDPHKD